MKLKYFGHACFTLTFLHTVLAIDPFDESVSYPPCSENCDVALVSHDHFDHNHVSSLKGEFTLIRTPGEYYVGGVHITALPCFHDEQQGALRGKNLIFLIEGEGLRIAHLGDLGHMPDSALMEKLKNLDLVMIPVGGTYTIDTPQAEALIKKLNPRCTVAMHFKTEDYDCNMATSAAFETDTGSVRMPRELEVNAGNLQQLPRFMVMNYK